MNIFVAIPFTLLALVAGMYLLAKAKTEGLNSYFRWIAYLVILVSLLMLACNLTRGALQMRHHRMEREECVMMKMDGGECKMMRHEGKGMMMDRRHCCKDEEKDGDESDDTGAKEDSTKAK